MDSRDVDTAVALQASKIQPIDPVILAQYLTKNWRKRVRVERTHDLAKRPRAGFEDREDHRTPCASVYVVNQFPVPGFKLSVRALSVQANPLPNPAPAITIQSWVGRNCEPRAEDYA